MTRPVFIHPRLRSCDRRRRKEVVVRLALVQDQRFDHEIGPFGSFRVAITLRPPVTAGSRHGSIRAGVPWTLLIATACYREGE